MATGLYKFIEGNEKIEHDWTEQELTNPPERFKRRKGSKRSYRVLSKRGEVVTLEQFTSFLAKIKYTVGFRGCDHHSIYNQKGQLLNLGVKNFEKDNMELELIWDESFFGGDYQGTLYGYLNKAEILQYADGFLVISFSGFSMSFYNNDKVLRPSEEYLKSLPKDFEARVFCKDCGTIQTKSYKKSALSLVKNSFSMGLSSAFGSPVACPKCKYLSFGDLNINTSMKYYRISTNRPVSYDSIEKISAKHKVEYNRLVREEDK